MDPKIWPDELSKFGVKYVPNLNGDWEVVKARFAPEIQQNAIQYVVQDERGNPLKDIHCFMEVPGEQPADGKTEGPESKDKNGIFQHIMGQSYIEKSNGGWGGGVHGAYIVNSDRSDKVTGMGRIVPEGKGRNSANQTSFELTFKPRSKPPIRK